MPMHRRLRQLRNQIGMSLPAFAKELGVCVMTLRRYESGDSSPNLKLVNKICTKFGVNPTWLVTGTGSMFTHQEPSGTVVDKDGPLSLTTAPVVDPQNVPPSFPQAPLQQDQILGHIYLPFGMLSKDCIAFRTGEDSMNPTIKRGDLVVFRPVDLADLRSGDIVVVKGKFNELLVRRFREKYRELFLVSDNPEYPPLKPDGNHLVIGLVLLTLRVYNFIHYR